MIKWLTYFENEVYYSIIAAAKEILPKVDIIAFKNSQYFFYLKQYKLTFKKNGKSISLILLIYIPNKEKKSPAFLAYNFGGYYKISFDPYIHIEKKNTTRSIKRGVNKSRWPLNKIIKSGYALITLNYNDVDPDKNNFSDGIHTLFYENGDLKPKENEWGSIAAWSWGFSTPLDFLKMNL